MIKITSQDGTQSYEVTCAQPPRPIEADDAAQLQRAQHTGYRLIFDIMFATEADYLAATQAIRAGTLE